MVVEVMVEVIQPLLLLVVTHPSDSNATEEFTAPTTSTVTFTAS